MEPRIAKLEALAEATKERMGGLYGRMDHLDLDLRALVKVMIAGFILTWSAFAVGFLTLNSRIDTVNSDLLARQDSIMDKMDRNHAAILDRLDRIMPPPAAGQDQ